MDRTRVSCPTRRSRRQPRAAMPKIIASKTPRKCTRLLRSRRRTMLNTLRDKVFVFLTLCSLNNLAKQIREWGLLLKTSSQPEITRRMSSSASLPLNHQWTTRRRHIIRASMSLLLSFNLLELISLTKAAKTTIGVAILVDHPFRSQMLPSTRNQIRLRWLGNRD